jgi:hypothetical protein
MHYATPMSMSMSMRAMRYTLFITQNSNSKLTYSQITTLYHKNMEINYCPRSLRTGTVPEDRSSIPFRQADGMNFGYSTL